MHDYIYPLQYGCYICTNSWDHLTNKNFELERLCMDLREEVGMLRHQAKLRYIHIHRSVNYTLPT